MRLYYQVSIIISVIGLVLIPIVLEGQDYYGKFPPTAAFRNFTTSTDTVEADSYADIANLVGAGGITITGNAASDTITFTGSGIPGTANDTKQLIVDYLIMKNSTHTWAQNGTNGMIDFIDTDSATLFNQVMDWVNSNEGGWVHMKGYGPDSGKRYDITTAIQIPDSGRLKLTGDGRDLTVLRIPIGSDNNMFEFTGVKTHVSHFNYFENFHIYGNDSVSGVTNTGFRLDATGFGIGDSVWQNLFIEHFAQDGIYFDNLNAWNLAFYNNVFEYSGRYLIYKLNGSDDKIIGNKFLYNKGTYAISLGGAYGTVIGNWFYQNDKHGMELRGGASGYTITGNYFAGTGDTNPGTYTDILLNDGDENLITGNSFNGGPTKHAVYISNLSTDNLVTANNFVGVGGGGYSGDEVLFQSDAVGPVNLVYGNLNFSVPNDQVLLLKTQTLFNKNLTSITNLYGNITLLNDVTNSPCAINEILQVNVTLLWDCATSGSGADNLGDHEATQDLNMTATNQITGSMSCSNEDIIKYNSTSDLWECNTETGETANPRHAVKSADEVVNNSSAYQYDDHLKFDNILADHTYYVEYYLIFDSDVTADIKFTISLTNSTGATGELTEYYAAAGVSSLPINSNMFAAAIGVGSERVHMARAWIFTDVVDVGGISEIHLRWAQTVATVADTTLHQGSFGELHDLGPRP